MKTASILLVALLLCNGCATALTNQLLQRHDAVRVEVDGKTVMAGVDLFALDEVAQHPFMHGFAAALDLGAGYLVYNALDDSGGSSSSTQSTTAYTIQTGDNSPVYFMENSSVNNNQSSTPAPAPSEETAQRARRAR